jgi:beta-lactam-binding protein with PASTA domain
LKQDTVKQARRTIAAAGCKTGQVRRARGAVKPLRVIGQSPRPGTWLAPGARVVMRVR